MEDKHRPHSARLLSRHRCFRQNRNFIINWIGPTHSPLGLLNEAMCSGTPLITMDIGQYLDDLRRAPSMLWA
jgi:glycosyltransferase involved in cell wall biosynthesis